MKPGEPWRSGRNRHYRRLFVARTISNLGNGIAPIALAFGVLALPGADAEHR